MTIALSAATAVTLCSLIGTVLSASWAGPQLRRLHRTHSVAGISATTSAFTVVSGISWAAYAWVEHIPLLVASSACAVLVQLPILTMLARAGAWPWSRRLVAAALISVYAAVPLVLGWTALGVVLVGHALVQYTPQVAAVLHDDDLAGISPASARLLLGSGAVWGLAGIFAADLPLMAWSVIVTSSASIILARVSATPAWLARTAHFGRTA